MLRSDNLFRKAKLAAVLGCLGFMATGCVEPSSQQGFQKRSERASPSLVVNVMRVTPEENATETSVFFGTLKPNRQSQLRFGRSGQIKTLAKEVGETLQAGQLIAQLELDQLEQQKANLEQAIKGLDQGFEAGRRDAQQLQAQLQDVQRELEKGDIVAPYDCVVASRNVVAGDSVSPQSPIVTVIESLPVLGQADLPLRIVQRLPVDQPIWVVIGNDAIEAKVKTKSPLESTAGSRTVSFQITGSIASGNWSFGQTVKIRFLTTTDNSGYWVPVSALSRESTGLWSVLVAKRESVEAAEPNGSELKVQRNLLELIQLEDEWALAQGTFEENEFVIVNGGHRVVPGQTVTAADVTDQFVKPNTGASE